MAREGLNRSRINWVKCLVEVREHAVKMPGDELPSFKEMQKEQGG